MPGTPSPGSDSVSPAETAIVFAMDARQRLNRNKKKKQGKNQKRSTDPGKGSAGRGRKKVFTGPKTAAGKLVKGKKNTAQPTKTLTRKISDLRQIITAPRPSAPSKQTLTQKKSAITKRLGLQSKSARDRIRNAESAASSSRNQQTSAAALKKSLTKKRPSGRFSNASAAPTIIIAQSPASNAPEILTDAGRTAGYSVIVSNLNPAVTQSDILELFGDVGSVKSFQNINSTTAMVTFSHPNQASAAVLTYNNRLLDGQPMHVTLIPAPAAAASAPRVKHVSQAFRRIFSRN